MATLRDAALPILESGRALIAKFGLRQVRVYLVTKAWTGASVGQGTPSTTTTEITNLGQPPKVRQLSAKEMVASGHLMEDEVYEIIITPKYQGGGTSPAVMAPSVPGSGSQEVFYKLVLPDGVERLCTKVSERLDEPFRWRLTVKTTGRRF